ncbi:MAG: hypothetical protein HYS05_06000, partial [Acidobacteria bacterium]|nr:hypothetical protein [Acidobacteriota bacterium]
MKKKTVPAVGAMSVYFSKGLGRSIVPAVLALVATVAAQQPAELIIRQGLVVTAVGRTEADLRIR